MNELNYKLQFLLYLSNHSMLSFKLLIHIKYFLEKIDKLIKKNIPKLKISDFTEIFDLVEILTSGGQ